MNRRRVMKTAGLRNTNNLFATALHSQKRDRLIASYGFYRLAASSSNSVEFIKLQQTTCSRLVIIKSEKAMRTHPDIDLMTARCRLAETCAFLAV